jgi:hypothetical protein
MRTVEPFCEIALSLEIGYLATSRQSGRTSAPIVPHSVQTIFALNDGTVRWPGRWSTFITLSWRQLRHITASDVVGNQFFDFLAELP